MSKQVSIIIPTYKRKESMVRLMKSLVYLGLKNYEFIVVEQVINNRAFFRNTAIKYKIPLKYFFLENSSTAKAMNVGAQQSKSKYLLFIDDDVVIHRGLIKAHIKNFANWSVAATVGRILTRGQAIESHNNNTGRVTWLGHFTDGFSSDVYQEVDTVIGCNTCWRKEIFTSLGGIDEQFTGNAIRLESDLSLRAKKNGYKIIFEPTAIVTHYREELGGARKTEGRLQWYLDFFSNEVYFFLKHKAKLLLPIFLLTKMEWVLRCMFGFGREVSIKSISTPLKGIIDGVRKYLKYTYSYEHRR